MAAAGRPVSIGLAYMYEPAFNRAIVPLLETGEVDALEWSFDTVAGPELLPGWQRDLLRAFAGEGRLYGHGVYYSLLNADWSERQDAWLRRLSALRDAFPFRHVSEHFGFMSSRNAHSGCPLPVPLTADTLQAGRDRLAALHATAGVPVGVENLALAFSRDDVLRHGSFLRELVEPVGGFVVLDLHNLYCQSHNFGLPLQELIAGYPLARVREIHLSGGSWAPGYRTDTPIRRDTHDASVPEPVLDALRFAVPRCPNLDVVILERLGDTLFNADDEAAFREEYRCIRKLVCDLTAGQAVPEWPHLPTGKNPGAPTRLPALYRQQQEILGALATSESAAAAKTSLLGNELLREWRIAEWDPGMIDTAIQLGQKWGIDRGA